MVTFRGSVGRSSGKRRLYALALSGHLTLEPFRWTFQTVGRVARFVRAKYGAGRRFRMTTYLCVYDE